MTRIYDTAVIGAGPAGSVFARELALKSPEADIIIIDGQSEKHKKPCGGLLAPDAQRVLAELGLTLPNDVLADPQIFTVETLDLVSGISRSYQRHYLNMDRYKFDRYLLSLVPDSVKVINARAEKIEKENGIFKLFCGSETVFARSVVGADGASSIVRRTFFKPFSKQYISIQEHYPDLGQSVPPYSCIFDPETSNSCSWTIRKNGYIIFGGAFDKKNSLNAFNRQKRRLEELSGVSMGHIVKREACLVTSPRHLSDFTCGNDGAYLIGEAAGFISASSFEGISSAMTSAIALAEAFSEKTDKGILSAYRKKTLPLVIKLRLKAVKRAVLCSPLLRRLIMASGIFSVVCRKRPALKTII